MTKEQIELYKQKAFIVLKEIGIGNEVLWVNGSTKAEVPNEWVNDLRDILYHQGFIHKTGEAKKGGHLIRGNASIIAAIYDTDSTNNPVFNERNSNNVYHQTVNVGGDMVGNTLAQDSFRNISSKADKSKENPTNKSKIDVPLILKIIAGIIAVAAGLLKLFGVI